MFIDQQRGQTMTTSTQPTTKSNGNPEAHQSDVWEMTMDEWKRIHRDFKGKVNGQRAALRLTGRGTCLVPVKIIKG